MCFALAKQKNVNLLICMGKDSDFASSQVLILFLEYEISEIMIRDY